MFLPLQLGLFEKSLFCVPISCTLKADMQTILQILVLFVGIMRLS